MNQNSIHVGRDIKTTSTPADTVWRRSATHTNSFCTTGSTGYLSDQHDTTRHSHYVHLSGRLQWRNITDAQCERFELSAHHWHNTLEKGLPSSTFLYCSMNWMTRNTGVSRRSCRWPALVAPLSAISSVSPIPKDTMPKKWRSETNILEGGNEGVKEKQMWKGK